MGATDDLDEAAVVALDPARIRWTNSSMHRTNDLSWQQVVTLALEKLAEISGLKAAIAEAIVDAEELYQRGMSFHQGEGVEQSFKRAAFFLRLAAQKGHLKAQLQLGIMSAAGQGMARNVTAGVEWFRQAAEKGDATAQLNLGSAYQTGVGVERDPEQAMEWFTKAAGQGDAKAQHMLGDVRYAAEEFESAAEWYARAAAQ